MICAELEAIAASRSGLMAMLCFIYNVSDLKVIEGLLKGIKIKSGYMTPSGLVASARNIVLHTVHEREYQSVSSLSRHSFRLQSQIEDREKTEGDGMAVAEEPDVIIQK